MSFSKISLGAIIAIAHDGANLQLLLNTGNSIELKTTPAPQQALDGILTLNRLCNLESISMTPVDSDAIAAIGYSDTLNVLQIDFKKGSRYRYLNVNPFIFEAFQSAPSKGRFFNREIDGNFDYQLVSTVQQ